MRVFMSHLSICVCVWKEDAWRGVSERDANQKGFVNMHFRQRLTKTQKNKRGGHFFKCYTNGGVLNGRSPHINLFPVFWTAAF